MKYWDFLGVFSKRQGSGLVADLQGLDTPPDACVSWDVYKVVCVSWIGFRETQIEPVSAAPRQG